MMNKEVISKEEYIKVLKEICEDLNDSVCKTLGPNGSTSIITDEHGKPYITKDGVSIINAMDYKDPVKSYILNIIKEGANKTLTDAGDGTTTTTLLITSIILLYINHRQAFTNKDWIVEIEELLPIINEHIKSLARDVTKEDVLNIAKTSSNGDEGISNSLKEAFSFSSNIQVEKSSNNSDILTYVEGVKYPVTYLDPDFINDYSTRSATLNNASVCIIDGDLEDVKILSRVLSYCNQDNKPLVIIADSISRSAMNILITNNDKGSVRILPVKTPGRSHYRAEYRKDIKCITGANIVKPKDSIKLSDLGVIEKITSNPVETLFVPMDTVDITQRVNELDTYKREPHLSEYDINIIEDRINNLNGRSVIYNVGGNSHSEMMERYDRVEDAVGAINTAKKHGVLKGGGVSLFNISELLISNTRDYNGYKLIPKILKIPYSVINNTDKFDKAKECSGVIDPAFITLKVIENSFSIAKSLLNVSSLIVNKSSWN